MTNYRVLTRHISLFVKEQMNKCCTQDMRHVHRVKVFSLAYWPYNKIEIGLCCHLCDSSWSTFMGFAKNIVTENTIMRSAYHWKECTFLLFVSTSDRVGHLFLYPFNVVSSIGVNTRLVCTRTAIAPTDNADKGPGSIHLTYKWASRITLQRTFVLLLVGFIWIIKELLIMWDQLLLSID